MMNDMRCKRCLAIARTLAVAMVPASAGMPAHGQVAPMSCGVSAGESRWLAESYKATHTYGLGDEEWIKSYGGLAAAGDSVFLYDQLARRIVHLSGELEERHAFGREGEGPGEFHSPIPITWLDDLFEGHVAFDGRRLVVYDRLRLASFDPSGEHRWSARRPATTVREGVRFVSPVDEEEIVFGVDLVDFTSRRLQLWRVQRADPHHHELLWERPVPWRSGDGPLPILRSREAASRWARHGDCVVVSDGGRRFLRVVDLSTLETDSVALPEWEVPAFGEVSIDRGAINFGGREVQRESEGPALLSRWTGLIVDPDGHAWIRAWTEARDEFEVFVVSLASGRSGRLVNPPGFPTAFGPPGVFYTALTKAETDEHYLARLEGQR